MSYLIARADACRIPLADQAVDLVFGSPPYVDARLYLEGGKNLGIARGCQAWVDWMRAVTTECLRVCRGPVVWVASGKTKDRTYWPACEGLMWEWWKRGGSGYRPCFWKRVGIPGSGGDQWFRADVEYVMCFKRPGKLPWSDNTAMGHPPKWAPGGEMSHRVTSGQRRNQWGHSGSGERGERRQNGTVGDQKRPSHRIKSFDQPNGTTEAQGYEPPTLANPGNLIETIVGGGVMGHKLAHENEAPFPEALAEHFIRSLCKPGGRVLDPFSGSGTTASVAAMLGRIGIATDLRASQCDLSRRRIAEQSDQQARPHRAQRNGSAKRTGPSLVARDREPSLFGDQS